MGEFTELAGCDVTSTASAGLVVSKIKARELEHPSKVSVSVFISQISKESQAIVLDEGFSRQ